ncbi:3'-5' exonuclease [Asticcacaulis endophyticus]|uniref:3'-5' exonuclease n=1 Tax=Asticcacaulis endophyticus TaxID=1395890 RepID=UPI001E5A2515|nr:3'-5' exonuclease [Asticcacaulis endophyticus]
MKPVSNQLDMFGAPSSVDADRRRSRARDNALPVDEAEMVRRLTETGRYRILTKLPQRVVVTERRPGFPRIGVIVDTETTGLSFRTHEVIEFGGVAFSFTDEGEMGDVLEVYGGLQEPTTPISDEITQLTGITNDMVIGQSLDIWAIERLIRSADLVIAHNAAFDRPFCELISPVFGDVPWACSNAEIGWSARGFEGSKLGYLVGQSGFFHEGHRAVDDCFALLEVLMAPVTDEGASAFTELYQASLQSRAKIWALYSPFETKDILKARGYRWSDGTDGQPKSWWMEVAETDLDAELMFLRSDIYQRADIEPVIRILSAVDRFKA